MIFNKTKQFNPLNLAQIFFLLFILTLFFPIRYVFPTTESYITGLYSDFTSFSLYISDVVLFIAFFFILWYNYKVFLAHFVNNYKLIFIILWLILATFIFNPHISQLNIWYFFKLIECIIVAYGTTVFISNFQFSIFKSWFFRIFIILGTIQSIIAISQFITQAPIGLSLFGEQQIYPYLSGVAKIVSDGTNYIRPYGTFPHPNVLSVFLIVTILFIIYFLLNQQKPDLNNKLFSNRYSLITNFWLNLALFINLMGITLTFSRGAFVALALGLMFFFGFMFSFTYFSNLLTDQRAKKIWQVNLLQVLIIIIYSIGLSFFIFKPFLLTRITISDNASLERGVYNRIGINIIKNHPVIGIGAGESVLHMEQYSPTKLYPNQIQPIHNYFLLSASEIGILGALLFFWLFFSYFWDLFKNLKFKIKNFEISYYLLLTTLLISFFILMLFDHYFYTIQSTQMLLWVILGITASTNKNGTNPNS